MHREFTLVEFLYLNIYGILLLIGGIAISLYPFWRQSIWLVVPQVLVAYPFLSGAYKILMGWNDKKRKYEILMERNKDNFRPDTFQEFMQAPCGRLLAKQVLKDLGKQEKYTELVKLKMPFRQRLRKGCQRQKVKVYINPTYKRP